MPRSLWTGSISFGLVNAPVKLYPAIAEHDLHFHYVHEPDGSRIGYEKVCKAEGEPVPDDELVKAFELDEGDLVYMSDEDFAAAEAEAYKAIEILDFVPYEQIDPIYFSRTYYLGPQEGAEKVYSLIAAAMGRSGLAAVARYVFHNREQLGCLRVRDGAITLENMYFTDEIRPLDDIVPKRSNVDKRELELALTLIEGLSGDFEPERYEDTYRERLLAIIEQKRKGKKVRKPKLAEPEQPSDLLAALRESLEHRVRDGNGRRSGAKGREDLESLTVEELAERARELEITGRSKMTKRELVRAIRSAVR